MCLYVKIDLIVNMQDDMANRSSTEVESLWTEHQRDKTNGKLFMGVCYGR